MVDDLEKLARRLTEFIEADGDELSGTVDKAYTDTLAETRRRLAHLGQQLDDDVMDAERVAALRGSIIRALAALETDLGPIDKLEDFLVELERARHVLRDALDEVPVAEREDTQSLASYLDAALAGLSQSDKARLAGVSTRQFQRWLAASTGRTASHRLALVVRLVHVLSRAWTPAGVSAWFERERRDLDGMTPLQALEDPGAEQELWRAVRRGRAQHGT
jgi:transcriptional regulator with XRE-family HTH domain